MENQPATLKSDVFVVAGQDVCDYREQRPAVDIRS